jgi:hypothetical protein
MDVKKIGLTALIGLVAFASSVSATYTETYQVGDWFKMIVDLGGALLMGFINQGSTISSAVVGIFLISLALALVFIALGGVTKAVGSLSGIINSFKDI